MGLYEYLGSQKVDAEIESLTIGSPFYTLIMAAFRRADTSNRVLLRQSFPEIWDELRQRYNAPGGALNQDEMDRVMQLQEQDEDGDDPYSGMEEV